MQKVLLVGLYSNEACPPFSLALARSIHANGCEVYAVLPADVENREEWVSAPFVAAALFVDINAGGSPAGKVRKLWVIAQLKLLAALGRVSVGGERTFDCTVLTFAHRWNTFVADLFDAGPVVLLLHDPKPHSDEDPRQAAMILEQGRRADFLVVLTRGFAAFAASEYGKAADRVLYLPHKPFDVVASKYRATDKTPTNYLFFGRINRYKGIDVLIEAFARLEASGASVRLTVAGKGDFSPYEEAFSRLGAATLMNEYVSDEDIERLFSMENCVAVVPYRDATQSGVIALALAYGVPVIASDTGGLREQLDGGHVGLFCEPGDVKSLLARMVELADDASARERQARLMSEYARRISAGYDDAVGEMLRVVGESRG